MKNIKIGTNPGTAFDRTVFSSQVSARLGIDGDSKSIDELQAKKIKGGLEALQRAATGSGDARVLDSQDLYGVEPKAGVIEGLWSRLDGSAEAQASGTVMKAAGALHNLSLAMWEIGQGGKSSFTDNEIGLLFRVAMSSINDAFDKKNLGRADQQSISALRKEVIDLAPRIQKLQLIGSPTAQIAFDQLTQFTDLLTRRTDSLPAPALPVDAIGLTWVGEPQVTGNDEAIFQTSGTSPRAPVQISVQSYPQTAGVKLNLLWAGSDGVIHSAPMAVTQTNTGRYGHNATWQAALPNDVTGRVRYWVEGQKTDGGEAVKVLPEQTVKL